jgi:hypothetical protein
MKSKFDFNDILIEPAMVSKISSRSEVNPFINGYLPLITAPMDTVVSVDNFDLYNKLKINVCLPRGEFIFDNNVFISYSLDDFIFLYEEKLLNHNGSYLIDIANGHMEKLITHVRLIKELYPTIRLMVGNIANPETYVELSNAGADFIRCGIGNGNACWVGDTLVTTNKGVKKIKDVEINDLVLTHTGNYEPVINTLSYYNNEELYEINGEICTKNHELYVTLKENIDIINDTNYKEFCFFISVELLDTDKHLIVSWDTDIIV